MNELMKWREMFKELRLRAKCESQAKLANAFSQIQLTDGGNLALSDVDISRYETDDRRVPKNRKRHIELIQCFHALGVLKTANLANVWLAMANQGSLTPQEQAAIYGAAAEEIGMNATQIMIRMEIPHEAYPALKAEIEELMAAHKIDFEINRIMPGSVYLVGDMPKNQIRQLIELLRSGLADLLIGAELSLAEADLAFLDFRGLDLRGIDFKGAILSGADLRETDLREVDLRGATLRQTLLNGADLKEADFAFADLSRARFVDSDLRGANLEAALLTGVDLSQGLSDLKRSQPQSQSDQTLEPAPDRSGPTSPQNYLWQSLRQISLGLGAMAVILTAVFVLVNGVPFGPPQVVEVEVTRVETITEVVEVEKEVEKEVEIEVEVTSVETVPAAAVEEVEVAIEVTATPPPQGGNVVQGTFADISTLNPIMSADRSSSQVADKMFGSLLQLDPVTGSVIPFYAERFELSENGETITFFLREDIFWSDGTQLTANDVVFTWDAINTDSVASPRRANFSAVDRWTPVGDFSVEVSLAQVDCAALLDVGSVSILPAHAYANDPENIVDSPENNGPTVVSGPFTFLEYVPESVVRLAANPNYYLGRPNIDTWTYRVYPDQSAEFAGFLAGEIDYIDVPPENVSVLEDAIASGQSFRNDRFFSDGYAYVGFNLANPENPQPGFEDLNGDGTFTRGEPPLEQDPHPVLSDVAVRKAIASAVDYTGIINQVIYGQGAPTAANVLPSIGWAYNADLELPVTDTELAAQILADAGWAPGDSTNDAGLPILEKEGQALTLILMTNQGATARENIVALLKEQLDELGFDIQLEITEFGTVVQKLLGQEFDMILLGWVGLGPEPDDSSFFSYENDEPGAGFNFVSYYNETFEANLKAGKAVPGCAEADRMPFYKANQAIFREDQPYVPLYIPLINSASALRLNGFEPNTWDPDGDFNIQDWTITP